MQTAKKHPFFARYYCHISFWFFGRHKLPLLRDAKHDACGGGIENVT